MTDKSQPNTEAFDHYLAGSNDIWRFVATLFGAALGAAATSTSDKESFHRELDASVEKIEWLRKNSRIALEMLLARLTDNFLSYVTDLLRLVIESQPRTMLSERGTVEVRQILEASSLDELKRDLIEERVLSLSYRSVDDLADYLKQKLGFEIFQDVTERGIVVKTVEARNIIAHNRGRINQRYIDRAGGGKAEIGAPMNIAPSNILMMTSYFDSLVRRIDTTACEKFLVKRHHNHPA